MSGFTYIRRVLRSSSDDEGFSLTELMVVAGLMVFVLGTAFTAFTTVGQMSDRMQAREQAASQSAVALDRVSRELRQAEAVTQANGTSAPLKQSSPDKVTFYADLNKNNLPVRVTYYVSGGYLWRTEAHTTTYGGNDNTYGAESTPVKIVPLDPSWTTVFTYYDSGSIPQNAMPGDFSQYTSPTAVTDPSSASAVTITLKSKVQVGASAMTVQSSSMVNIRTTDTLQ